MLGSIKNLKNADMLALGSKSDEHLMKTLKNSALESSPDKKKQRTNRRQEIVDEKIERLLLAYKQKDEIAHKKVHEIEKEKKLGKKNLMEKFGFSDDEEEDVVLSAAEIKKKQVAL